MADKPELQNRSPLLRFSQGAAGFVALILSFLTLNTRWQWLLIQPFPMDYDGFYYLQEITYRLETGHGYYHAFSPFFALATWVARWTLSPMQAFNLIVFVSFAVWTLALGLLVAKNSSWWVASLFVYAATQSEALFLGHYCYLKQGSAMALVAAAACLVAYSSAWRKVPSAGIVVGFALLLLAGLFHRFSILCSLPLLGGWKARSTAESHVKICLALALLAVFAIYSVLSPKYLLDEFLVGTTPAWEFATRFGFLSALELNQYRIYIVTASLCILAAAIFRERNLHVWALWGLYLLMILPIWRMGGGFWYRMLISSVWILFMVLALIRTRFKTHYLLFDLQTTVIAGCALAMLMVRSSVPRTNRPLGPAMRIETLAAHAETLRQWLPQEAFIQAPHGIQFRATYFLKRKSAKDMPPPDRYPLRYVIGQKAPAETTCSPVVKAGPDVGCLQLDQRWFIWRLPPSA